MDVTDDRSVGNSTTEITSTGEYDVRDETRTLAEIILPTFTLACIMLLSISGNTVVLLAILRERVLHNKTSIFMANLAIADLFNATFCMITIMVSCLYDKWIFGEVFCGVIGALTILVCTASINTLGAIALDRYFAIASPFKYSHYMSPKRIAGILVWIWTQSLLFCLMPVIGWSEYVYISKEYMCSADWSAAISYTITIIVVNMTVPIMLMTYCYVHIFRIASAHRKQLESQVRVSRANSDASALSGVYPNGKTVAALAKRARQMRRDTKAATTLLVVMGTFLLCWLPHVITMLCIAFPQCTAIPDAFYVVSTWFAMLNSACNPFIYCITNKQLREAFKRTLVKMLPSSLKRKMATRVDPDMVSVIDSPTYNCASQAYALDLDHVLKNERRHDRNVCEIANSPAGSSGSVSTSPHGAGQQLPHR